MVKQATIDGICYVAGCVCYALSVIIFTAPNHIAPGGVTGVATVLNYLWDVIPIGTAIFVMNVPLLIASWLKAGRSFTVRTLIATFLSSVCIDLLEPFVPSFVDNTLLVPIFGGVLMGLGVGLLIMRGASTGGSEIVARLLERKMPHIPIGRFILLVDAVIVGADRICANGDFANKIGTYGLAVLAKAHDVPFYVAAPQSTFDRSLDDGSQIVIEQRPAQEVRCVPSGREWPLVAPRGCDVYNPAFDVTPHELVTAYITELS
jgi:uncharacterized membrane protein YczE